MSDACSGVLANSGPAPPPPPPPPGAGQVPTLRISTATELGPRRGAGGQQQQQQQEGYEPPAAIQNAMMTKDKKPFTYTPGMGGKLDLSQIRSPRMARRVAKNANDEGIEGPPKVLDQDTTRSPSSPPQPSVYSQPQVAVPVFPQGGPQLGSVNLRNSCLPRNPVGDKQEQPVVARPTVRVDTRSPAENQQSPTPPTSPTQVTLSKAPTPWMQRQVSKEQELPEWAKRSGNRCSQESTPSAESPQPRQIVFVNPSSPPVNQQQPQPQYHAVPQAQVRAVPPVQQPNVPLRIEDRPSVFTAINEPGHHQFVNSNPHHVSRWGNPVGQSGYQPQGAAYIVPVQVDSTPQQQQQQQQQYQQNNHYNQNQMQYSRNAPDNRNVQRGYAPMANQQPEPGPVQSQSFRVLQKITDTYNPDQVDGEQMRKLQLTEDDRCLMNKFKEQVDGEQYLHQEEDPRYRGAAIPSRAFRYLQTMTDSADVPNSTSRPVNSVPKKPNRNSNTFEEVPMQPYIPASQQQVQEPKKYTGGAIPSRSFRILQQMTTPESVAIDVPRESGRDSTTTELFDMPFDQQGVHSAAIPPSTPTPFASPIVWDPQIGRWTCYPFPVQCQTHAHSHLHPCLCHSPCFYCTASKIQFDRPCHNNNNIAHRRTSASSDRETTTASCCRGNRHARNSSDLCLGCPWRCNSTTTDQSERYAYADEGRPVTPTFSSFLDDDHDHFESAEKPDCSVSDRRNDKDIQGDNDDEDKQDDEEEEEEQVADDDEEEETEIEQKEEKDSSDSSCDSESYWAYSTGLNPLNRRKETTTQETVEREANGSDEEDSDSTDCEKVSQFEEDNDTDKNEDSEEINSSSDENDEEEDGSTTVSVNLPLRFKYSVSNEDATTVVLAERSKTKNEVETCVDFTLKRVASQETSDETATSPVTRPTFIVTASEAFTIAETTTEEETKADEDNKELLRVRNNWKEEITDDEDSGVTSDVSRIISEVDSDSECYQSNVIEHVTVPPPPPPSAVTRRFGKGKKYERTQTHSRLFKLLSDEQSLSSSRPTTTPMHEKATDRPMLSANSLPPRPKSLDCEALFTRDQSDSYYPTCTTNPTYHSALPQPQIFPRRNVYCPRTNSAKNIPRIFALKNQQMQSCTRSSNHANTAAIPSNIPTPIRLNRRC